jgi:hypothetical protein
MRIRVAPSGRLLFVIAVATLAALSALLLAVPLRRVAMFSVGALIALLILASVDYVLSLRAWRRSAPRLTRRLPPAFAIGVGRHVSLSIDIDGRV